VFVPAGSAADDILFIFLLLFIQASKPGLMELDMFNKLLDQARDVCKVAVLLVFAVTVMQCKYYSLVPSQGLTSRLDEMGPGDSKPLCEPSDVIAREERRLEKRKAEKARTESASLLSSSSDFVDLQAQLKSATPSMKGSIFRVT
jgi:hypothetical protein